VKAKKLVTVLGIVLAVGTAVHADDFTLVTKSAVATPGVALGRATLDVMCPATQFAMSPNAYWLNGAGQTVSFPHSVNLFIGSALPFIDPATHRVIGYQFSGQNDSAKPKTFVATVSCAAGDQL
jgi:hypothetical protein